MRSTAPAPGVERANTEHRLEHLLLGSQKAGFLPQQHLRDASRDLLHEPNCTYAMRGESGLLLLQ
jgi:predicted ArsR family transcriptional regulator